jgi:hypothetical protein
MEHPIRHCSLACMHAAYILLHSLTHSFARSLAHRPTGLLHTHLHRKEGSRGPKEGTGARCPPRALGARQKGFTCCSREAGAGRGAFPRARPTRAGPPRCCSRTSRGPAAPARCTCAPSRGDEKICKHNAHSRNIRHNYFLQYVQLQILYYCR